MANGRRQISFQASLEMAAAQIRKPRAEIRPAATARQRGEKKSEIRTPSQHVLSGCGRLSDFGFRVSSRLAGFRLSDFSRSSAWFWTKGDWLN
jgi:hypothetical protein